MLTRENCITYAENFVHQLKRKGIDISTAKLFGSYSKGLQTEDSDIDLLLVSDRFVGVGFIDNLLIADELIDFDLIQARTYSLDDYSSGDPFIDEINRNCININ